MSDKPSYEPLTVDAPVQVPPDGVFRGPHTVVYVDPIANHRPFFRKLVDAVWSEATESKAVPIPELADSIITKVFLESGAQPVPHPPADAPSASVQEAAEKAAIRIFDSDATREYYVNLIAEAFVGFVPVPPFSDAPISPPSADAPQVTGDAVTPIPSSDPIDHAIGGLSYLLSVCRCKEDLSADEERIIRDIQEGLRQRKRELIAERNRLWDLCRHQRGELLTADLITKEEFAELAKDHPAVARLENYDALRAERDRLKAERDDALKVMGGVNPMIGWQGYMPGDVSGEDLRCEYCSGVSKVGEIEHNHGCPVPPFRALFTRPRPEGRDAT